MALSKRSSRSWSRGLAAATLIGAVAALAACSSLVSIPVDDFTLPAGTTNGQACFQRVEAENALPGVIGTAAYRADATYTRGLSIGTDAIQMKFYGRTSAPAETCIDEDAAGNVALSSEITLPVGEPTAVEVGGSAFGGELADVVSAGTFWIGGAVQNEGFGAGDTVTFENGRITVGF